MKNILLDLRGQSLHAMVADGAAVMYAKRFEPFSRDNSEQVDRVLQEIAHDSGMKLDRVHVVIPAVDTVVQKHSIPHMSPADAEKVLRRKLLKASSGEAPLFHAVPAETSGERLSYLVETIERDTLKRSIAFLRDHGATVKTATTALQANVKLMSSMEDDPARISGLVDIGDDLVEIVVLSRGLLMSHAKVALPALDLARELQSGKALDRIQKVRVYQVAEAIFNALADYKKDYPDEPLQTLRLCGTSFALRGVLDALKDTLDAEVRLLNNVDLEDGTGFYFSTLNGFALAVADNTAKNFLTRDMISRALPSLSKPAVAALVILYISMLAGISVLMELKYVNVRNKVQTRQQTALIPAAEESDLYSKQSAALKNLLHGHVDTSGILGYLADRTPDGVYVNTLSFSRKGSVPALDIDFVAPYNASIGERRFLTRIVSMLDLLGDIKRAGQPIITITKQNKSRLIHCKVHCEVALHD